MMVQLQLHGGIKGTYSVKCFFCCCCCFKVGSFPWPAIQGIKVPWDVLVTLKHAITEVDSTPVCYVAQLRCSVDLGY